LKLVLCLAENQTQKPFFLPEFFKDMPVMVKKLITVLFKKALPVVA
jgi:hypothetical protein